MGAFGLVVGDEDARDSVIDVILDNLPLRPGEGRRDLRELLESVTGNLAGFGVVGLAGLAFAGSGLMGVIRHGLNAAWETEEIRPPLRGKLLDILLVGGVGLAVAVSLALTLVVRIAASLGAELGEAVPAVVLALGQLAPVAVSFLVFAFLYRVVPAVDTRLRDVWLGALVAALGYEAAKTGFALYLRSAGDYGAIYGSIGAVIAFMVFVFIAAAVFLLGAQVASEWPGVRDADPETLETDGAPLGERVRGVLRGLVTRRGE